jgi:predicted small metal-binding protein
VDFLYSNLKSIYTSKKDDLYENTTCREAGFDCDYVVKGETEEEIMRSGEEHAINAHGMKKEDCTPEFKEKLRPLIKDT